MCIICNAGSASAALNAADNFMTDFRAAGDKMRAAERNILTCAKTMPKAEDRQRYARLHKAMVRLRRQWNALEQQREARA